MSPRIYHVGPEDRESQTLLLLLADTPIPPVVEAFGDYHRIFGDWLTNSYKSLEGSKRVEKSLKIISYDVVNGEYPSEEDESNAIGVMITGSVSSAYEKQSWILDLTSYIHSLPNRHPSLKIIGICFGHQIIGNAFSESGTALNEKGWELGVKKIELTEEGKKIFESEEPAINLHQVHRDHLPSLPPSFTLLSHNAITPVHAMARFSDSPSLSTCQILSVQGHPEFKPELVLKIIDFREQKGIFNKEFADDSRVDAKKHDDGIRVGRTILKVLGF